MANETRKITRFESLVDKLVLVLCICMTVFHIYTARFGVLGGMRQSVLHLLFVMVIGYCGYVRNAKNAFQRIFALVMLLAAAVSLGYNYIDNDRIMDRIAQVTKVTKLEMILGIILIVTALDLARRCIGWALPIISTVFIVYGLTSQYMPGVFYNRAISLDRFVEHMYLTTTGIFGECIKVSATFIFLFVFFGSLLEASGGGEFFMDVAKCAVGKKPGGPGLMAVVSSALMGTISGSAVANVMTTGVFTIPLMRRVGFEKNFAGAVEAVASSGGQILPPIMGSAAFLMAEIVGVPYSDIARAAALPALLYFLAVFLQIYFEARRTGMNGLEDKEIPKLKTVLSEGWPLFIPLAAIIYFILSGWSTMRSGYYGILCVILITCIKKNTRLNWGKFSKAILSACKSMVTVASACACAGIIVGVVKFTGFSLKFGSAVVRLSGGNLMIALIMCMLAAIILGMGLPTPAAYVIQAALTAPALVEMGMAPLAAHMFILYFSSMAVITPPVALGAFAASSLCEGNATIIGFKAFRLGLVAFIVPYMFAYGSGLLLEGAVLDILLAVISSVIGVLFIAVALTGWFKKNINMTGRVLMFAAALCLLDQGALTDIIGLGLGFSVILIAVKTNGILSRAHV